MANNLIYELFYKIKPQLIRKEALNLKIILII